ncbi:MAG: hypothetical protein M3Z05_16730 [Gemmatimonadota bacterium]|nr:hypothetical protein [Gemmatimonadota bacterium]
MESSRAAPPEPRTTLLTRALCLLVVLLMTVAGVYGAYMALHYYHQIGV